MLSEHKFVGRPAHVLGTHDFVGFSMLEHTILVNPALVGKRIGPDNGFVWLNWKPGNC